ELQDLAVPTDWHGLAEFSKLTRKEVSRLRGQVPGVEEQKDLLKKQHQVLGFNTALGDIRRRWADASANTCALDKLHGSRKAVEAAIAGATDQLKAEQDRLRRTSARAAVVNEAIQYFDTAEGENASCPVCETQVSGLGEKIRELWDKKLKAIVERITVNVDG